LNILTTTRVNSFYVDALVLLLSQNWTHCCAQAPCERERIDLQKMKRELDPDSNLFDKRKIYGRRKQAHTTQRIQHPKQSTRRGCFMKTHWDCAELGARARERDAISPIAIHPSIAFCRSVSAHPQKSISLQFWSVFLVCLSLKKYIFSRFREKSKTHFYISEFTKTG
jgi:hypothetical protein